MDDGMNRAFSAAMVWLNGLSGVFVAAVSSPSRLSRRRSAADRRWGHRRLQDEVALLALAFVPGGTPGTTPETGMLPEAAARHDHALGRCGAARRDGSVDSISQPSTLL